MKTGLNVLYKLNCAKYDGQYSDAIFCQHEKFRVEQELVNAEPVTCSKASDRTKRSAGISLVD